MKKDFDGWNEKKKKLHERTDARKVFFKEREMWWCSLGANIGAEQDGTGEDFSRPIIVIRQYNLDIALVVPLTSRKKKGLYYVPIGTVEGRPAAAIISQIRLIDKKRFDEKIGMLGKEPFGRLLDSLVGINFCRTEKSSPPQKRGRGRSRL